MAWVGDNKMNMVEGAQMIETRSEETLRKTYLCNARPYSLLTSQDFLSPNNYYPLVAGQYQDLHLPPGET